MSSPLPSSPTGGETTPPLPLEGDTTPADVFVFGDLTASFDDELRRLLHIRGNEALTSLFERVAFALRQELGRQPSAVQGLFPRFTTLIDLVAAGFDGSSSPKTEGAPVLQFTLMTVCQLAKFIHFSTGSPFPSADNTVLLGICTGSLAASAIAASRSIAEVVLAGVEATMVAFRTALLSFLQRGIITTSGNRPWSAVVPRDKPVQKLVDQFREENPFSSKLSTVYISATTPSSATVSGPPDVLNDFLARSGLPPYRLPIESPFHAAHIFGEADIDAALAGFPDDFRSYRTNFTLLSGSTGDVVAATDLEGLLRAAVSSVLREKVEWEGILTTLGSTLAARSRHQQQQKSQQTETETQQTTTTTSKCTVLPFFCNTTSLLSSYLAHEAGVEVVVQNMIRPRGAAPARPTGRLDETKIAIVGYSGRFPEAGSSDELWDLLRAGRDVHRDIPADRFRWQTYYDAAGRKRNTNKVRHGCFISEPGLFDTQFFNMSPREACSTDPAHRLAITATYEAMEMAGMVPNRTPSTQQDRVGVFFGVTSDDWREVNSSQDVGTYFIPGGVRAFMPGRISYFFRFSGPSLCIDTACSSSFAAIQSACGYLLRGECDTAIAGGTNVLTNPDIFTGLDRGHFLAGSGNCNTFDDEASGYCRAEAVGAVILKRLEDAIEDQDPIFGVIAGSNTNHCGQTDSITRPHEGDQVSVFRRVLRYQGVDPNDISYVEMHGTGTQAGDATEMRSVLSVFLPDQKRAVERPLYLGSAKANIGHSESASGVASLIKVLLMMKHAEIPPHCGIKTRINRNYPTDLAQRNVRIAMEPTPWRRDASAGGVRRTFLNNFSAAGGNTALLLEDAPVRPTDDAASEQGDRPGTYLVAVSAKTTRSLAGNIAQLAAYLEANPSTSLPALSYTTTARRIHHKYRVACSGSSVAAIAQELAQLARSSSSSPPPPTPPPAKAPKVALVFSGQGSLYSGIGRELYHTVGSFRADVDRFDGIARQHGFPSFVGLVDGSAPATLNGFDTCASHLALAGLQMALSRLWAAWGVRPAVVVGHSLGEYAALFAAGVTSASDTILLVGTRATLLARLCRPGTHGMLAVKAGVDSVRPLLVEEVGSSVASCEVTCINQPNGTVVGGELRALDQVAERARARGYQTVALEIPYSFHTAQVEPILDDFARAARGVRYAAPKVPVLSPLLGRVVAAGEEGVCDGDYLARACRGVVDFQSALEAARGAGVVDASSTVWLELGAHPACGAMVRATLGAQATTLASAHRTKPAWACVAASLETLHVRGVNVDWNNLHRGSGGGGTGSVLELPRYSWDLKRYWIDYKNDFLLTKGECCAAKPAGDAAVAAPRKPPRRYISPSVQRVLEEEHTAARSTMLVESDLFDDRLLHAVQGHKVNGAALCPSSLHGDIALTIAKDLVEKNKSAQFTGFDVCDVKIDRPLIALPTETTHLFRVSATADWAAKLVSLSVYSVDSSGSETARRVTAKHATLNVRLLADRSDWLADWRPVTYLIRSRITALEAAVVGGNSHRLKRPMVYKLFRSIVDYSAEYQGMQEVILDSDELEATARVVFRVDDQGFVMNPHWIDSLGHLAGFIMNGNEYNQSDKQVFINHGWSRLRFGETPQPGKVYTTYSKMQLQDGNNKLYLGDTYILDGDRIIAMFDRVAFQGVPRKVLDKLLPNTEVSPPTPTTTIKKAAAIKKDLTLSVPKKSMPALPAQIKPPRASQPSKGDANFRHVLSIIADEVGITVADLQPDAQLADFGLDSLLSLTISSRINEEMGIDVPSTLFVEHPTAKDLRTLFATDGDSSSSSASDGGEVPSSLEVPELGLLSDSEDSRTNSSVSSPAAQPSSPVTDTDGGHRNLGATMIVVRQAIAEETGIPVEELEASACLADLGVDSLLGLTIADSLTEALGAEVSSDLLLENQTLQDLEATLGKVLGLGVATTAAAAAATVADVTELTDTSDDSGLLTPPTPDFSQKAPSVVTVTADDDEDEDADEKDAIVTSEPHATSIVLHHARGAARRTLFLLPDGSGSAASYARLARLDADVQVYGLNCPWRTTPEAMTALGVTVPQVTAKFLAEMRRRQPRGPYYLGGWSAGGIFALEAARALAAAGETVARLLLVDAPNPIGLENPPSRMFDFFESAGVFGACTGSPDKKAATAAVPRWLRHHFDATVQMLDGYAPRALPRGAAPATVSIVYAKEGICSAPGAPQMATREDDPREMIWLLRDRTDFSAAGWRSLLGEADVRVHVLEDVNHFSMMNEGPRMEEMREHVRREILNE